MLTLLVACGLLSSGVGLRHESSGVLQGIADGTSIQQYQEGVFRLITSSGYRALKPAYALDFHAHTKLFDLPYTFNQFAGFCMAIADLYEGAGVGDEHKIKKFRDVMKKANNDMLKNLQAKDTEEAREMMEQAKKDMQITQEQGDDTNTEEYTQWNPEIGIKELRPVIFQEGEETYWPVQWWYTDFLTAVLDMTFYGPGGQVPTGYAIDDTGLETWFHSLKTRLRGGYGQDVVQAWGELSRQSKIKVMQAMRLTESYLLGPQKQRERDPHVDQGDLSAYVPFIDAYLRRENVRREAMRTSFPYYLGPATWRFMHTTAEIIRADNNKMLGHFVKFFVGLTHNYACPFCRGHLNKYVKLTVEMNQYPIEYTLAGWTENAKVLSTSYTQSHGGIDQDFKTARIALNDKIKFIQSGDDLAFFLWALHNSVSSSIARSEDWYHQWSSPDYTTRWWGPDAWRDKFDHLKSIRHGLVEALGTQVEGDPVEFSGVGDQAVSAFSEAITENHKTAVLQKLHRTYALSDFGSTTPWECPAGHLSENRCHWDDVRSHIRNPKFTETMENEI